MMLRRQLYRTTSYYSNFTNLPDSRKLSSLIFCTLTIFSISEFMAQHQESRSRRLLVLKTNILLFEDSCGTDFVWTALAVGSWSAFMICGCGRYQSMNSISSSLSSVSSPSWYLLGAGEAFGTYWPFGRAMAAK